MPTYFSLAGSSFSQNWTSTGLITTDDNWNGVTSIVGYLGDIDAGSLPDVDPRTLTADALGAIDVIANQSNPDTLAQGGVAEFDGIANPTVALQGSNTADAPALVLYLDATGRQNIRVQFNARDIDGSVDNAAVQLNVQYRVGDTGTWSNVTGGYFADVTTGPSQATLITPVDVTLPSAANNQAKVEVRILVTNATLADEWVGIDDIVVSSAAPTSAPIYTIQGSGLTSPIAGQTITTTGVVTAVDTTSFGPSPRGFHIQDPVGDANPATSDAIFVALPSGSLPSVGDSVTVTGNVDEFTPVGAPTGSFSSTEIASVSSVVVNSTGNPLPAAVTLTAADLTGNAERYEFMRVNLTTPSVVGPSNSLGETFVAPSGTSGLTTRGNLLISGGQTAFGDTDTIGAGADFNPERVQIAIDTGILPAFLAPSVNVGAQLSNVTGILTSSAGNHQLLPTATYSVAQASTLTKETGTLTGDGAHLLLASFDASAVTSSDEGAAYNAIAQQILNSWRAPDVVAIQELRDNNGSLNNGVTSAASILQNIVNALNASAPGGVHYAFIDNPFIVNNASGGEPGQNFRNAYLYRNDRLSLVANSLKTLATDGTPITTNGDQAANPDNAFFNAPPPLAATFRFNGQDVTVINNHFTSKDGSAALLGSDQPPFDAGEVQRAAQAQAVNNFVDSLLLSDPNAHVVVAGELNELAFEQPLSVLKGTASITGYDVPASDPLDATATYAAGGSPVLTDLHGLLPAGERYNYISEGNSETLDYVLVSNSLASRSEFDVVRVNADFADQIGQHEPLVARLGLDPLATPSNLQWHHTGTDEVRHWTWANGSVASNLIIAPPASAWQIAAVGNFNADGIADLVWQNNSSGDTRVWLMNASGLATSIYQGSVLFGWQVAATGDFNGGGTDDMLWLNTSTGEIRTWFMENGQRVSQFALASPTTDWFVTGSGDFNGDGIDDILWRNSTTGQMRDWSLDGNGAFSAVKVLPSIAAGQKVAATGDFNGDGADDIVFHNITSGVVEEWLMSNANVATIKSLGTLAPEWKLSGAGDYDQNGTDDLVWHNPTTGEAVEWKMSAGNHILTTLLGTTTPAGWEVSVNPATHADLWPLA